MIFQLTSFYLLSCRVNRDHDCKACANDSRHLQCVPTLIPYNEYHDQNRHHQPSHNHKKAVSRRPTIVSYACIMQETPHRVTPQPENSECKLPVARCGASLSVVEVRGFR